MQLVEFELETGGSVLVEVDERSRTAGAVRRGTERTRRSGEIAVKAGQTFESSFARVQPAAVALVAKLRGLAESPDEIEVEFGVQLSAEVGAIIAHTAGKANFSVRLTWKRDSGSAV